LTISTHYADAKETNIHVHNVYNPPQTSDQRSSCLPALRTALSTLQNEHITLGDFNLHNELWGGPTVQHGDAESQELLEIFGDYQLDSLLPASTVTFDDRNAQTCIDLCYGTQEIVDRVIRCGVDHEMDHNSDHLLITIHLDLRPGQLPRPETRDWANIDVKPQELPPLRNPRTVTALDRYVEELMDAVQSAATQATSKKRPSTQSKPGWTTACKEIQMEARRLKRQNSQLRTEESWEAYRIARNQKVRVIQKALRHGHREQVEKATKDPKSMWKLVRWARNRNGAPAKTKPELKDSITHILYTEAREKAELLRATFFPTPPEPDLQDIREAE
jgi:hypothetical protein